MKKRFGQLRAFVVGGISFFFPFFCCIWNLILKWVGLVWGTIKKNKKVRMPPVRPILQSVRQFAPPLALRLRWSAAPVCLHTLWPPLPPTFQPKSSRRPQQLPTFNARQHLIRFSIKPPSTPPPPPLPTVVSLLHYNIYIIININIILFFFTITISIRIPL